MPGKVKPEKRITTEAELRALVDAGKTFVEISSALGINVQSLRQTCSILGIRSPYRRHAGCRTTGARAEEFFADFRRGKSIAEIAKLHGVSRQSVSLTLRRAGLPACSRSLVAWLLSKAGEAA